MNEGFTIGELARAGGVGVETVRYYLRRGLLEQPPRPSSGFRRYPERAARRLLFIRRAQELGFSLSEIHELLGLSDGRSGPCGEARRLAIEKLAAVESRIRGLERLREKLSALAAACAASPDEECPILDVLEEGL